MAEHGHDHTGDLDRDGWHGTMNYVGFTDPVWSWLRAGDEPVPNFLGTPGGVVRRDTSAILATMDAYRALVSWRSYRHSWQLLGSHDSARIRTVVGDAARQEVAVGLLATMPGTPMIYAGDEIGLTGGNGEGSRTPMPWHRPESWDHRTFASYRSLVALRRAEPALRHGGLRRGTSTPTPWSSSVRRRPARCWCWPGGPPACRCAWPACSPPREGRGPGGGEPLRRGTGAPAGRLRHGHPAGRRPDLPGLAPALRCKEGPPVIAFGGTGDPS